MSRQLGLSSASRRIDLVRAALRAVVSTPPNSSSENIRLFHEKPVHGAPADERLELFRSLHPKPKDLAEVAA
jgi:hypothetical protein